MPDEQHDPSGTSNPQNFKVPPPMQDGDPRTVPPLGDTSEPVRENAPEEEKVERSELPDGLEYVSDNDGDGIRQTDLPWRGF